MLESPLPHLSRKGEENDTGGHLVGLAIEQKVPGALCYEQDVVEVQRVLSAVGPDEIRHLPDVRRVEQQLATVLGAVECHVTHRRKVPTGLRCVHSTSPATRRRFDAVKLLRAFTTMATLLSPVLGQAGPAELRDATARMQAIADGVFVIVHDDATDEWPHGNTGVIVGNNGVLVVDSNYLPSRAEGGHRAHTPGD